MDIYLDHLTTGYADKPLTQDVCARLHTGELTCLLGPNGAGKSTLLKTLCAFIPPLSGTIIVDGKDIRSYRSGTLARTIGVVLTERPTAINLTVYQLVALGRSPYTSFFGGLKSEDRRIVADAIRMVGIEHLSDRPLHTLSDGECQKAFIAKTLAQQTQIIFLDEPTAFLDYPSKVEIMKLLLWIAHTHRKMIFLSTHDIEIALQVADKLWLLDRQRGLSIGTPRELAASGQISAYFERPGLSFDYTTLSFKISD